MVTPKCFFFGKCGGCNCQHIDYQTQIEDKRDKIRKIISFNNVELFHCNDYNYRNRMDFIFHKNGLGLRKKGQWNKIINIDRCEIADEKINSILSELQNNFSNIDYFDINTNKGTYKYAMVRVTEKQSAISFTLNKDSMKLEQAIGEIKEFAKNSIADNIIISYVNLKEDSSTSSDYFIVKGSDELTTTILDNKFSFNVQGFFQNNLEVTQKMHNYVNEIVKDFSLKNMGLLDLYGGVGTFGIINSGHFDSVTIMENSNECIDSANKNIFLNNVGNATAIVKDAKNLKPKDYEGPLFVITDPPRSGMHPMTISSLNKISPKYMIYVSCNPTQLAKDIKKFKKYKIGKAAVFDMFPQTNHIEVVVFLIKD